MDTKYLKMDGVIERKGEPMADLIDRQAAIDLLKRWSGGYSYIEYDTESAIYEFERLPSAQPYTEAEIQKMQDLEQAELEKAFELGKAEANRWIPCSERLPETDDMMLVTCKPKKGEPNVNRAYFMNGYWHGSGSMSNVIAWMPLPEPYKPERSEE